jgi:hypothetical protein
MSDWTYKNEVVTNEMIPEKALCFVYRITRLSDGKFYYGKKLIFFKKTAMKTVTLKSGVKKKKKVSTLIPSDWKIYWSSSVDLQASVAELGEAAFSREILMWFENKGSASFYEAQYQFDNRVLTDNHDKSWNGIINLRCHWKHIKPPL